jgi:trehalose 6-phosphate synthase/phosphatase
MNAPRLVIVSNRLPITVEIAGDQITFSQASGGLATGLRGCHERMGGVWIGWPGLTPRLSKSQRVALDRQLAERGIVALYLTRQEIKEYYEEFAYSGRSSTTSSIGSPQDPLRGTAITASMSALRK